MNDSCCCHRFQLVTVVLVVRFQTNKGSLMNDLFSHYNSNAQRYVVHEYVPCAPKGETHHLGPFHRHGRCFSTAPTMVKITSTTEQMRLTSRGFRRRNPTLVRQRRKPRPKTTTTTTQPTTNDIKPLLRWCIPFEFTLYRYIRVTYPQIKNQTYTRISFFLFSE